jgi:hypothetical protein
MVFVDFWNLELSMQETSRPHRFRIDWSRLGGILAAEAGRVVGSTLGFDYRGMRVYGSYDSGSDGGRRLHRWATGKLADFAGVYVDMKPRRRRRKGPTCPACHQVVQRCPDPQCRSDMRGTEEKGVDVQIVTDMVSLAWADNYDVAVLVSSDRDFIPVVGFLQTKGIRVVHGAFPPSAAELTGKCRGSVSIPAIRARLART